MFFGSNHELSDCYQEKDPAFINRICNLPFEVSIPVEEQDVNLRAKLMGISKVKVYELIKHSHLKAMNLAGLKVAIIEIDRFIEAYSGKDLSDLDNVNDLNDIDETPGAA